MDPAILSIKKQRKHVPANQRQYTVRSLAKHIFPSYLPGLRVELRVKWTSLLWLGLEEGCQKMRLGVWL